jgi:ABC-type multidrug transport system ATPase subunit
MIPWESEMKSEEVFKEQAGGRVDIQIDPRTKQLRLRNGCKEWDVRLLESRDGSSNGVNDWIKSGAEVEVCHLDTIQIKHKERQSIVRFKNIEPAMYYGLLAEVSSADDGKEREVLKMEATPVYLSLDDDRGTKGVPKVSGAYLSIKAGDVCAIMGMSGCGKSLFLEILAGVRKPSNSFSLSFSVETRNKTGDPDPGDGVNKIGALDPVDGVNKVAFVRQEDPLLGDLTLEQSLGFRCRLMWPWMSPAVVKRTVKMAADMVEPGSFRSDKPQDWMGKRIGAPLDRDGVMSGGQRRRANIAHELIGLPIALLMDEPTSGLSSSDAQSVVEAIIKHAKNYKMPVVMCVHQPPLLVYKQFDSLLIMAKPGRVLFHGPRRYACTSLFKKLLDARMATERPQDNSGIGLESRSLLTKKGDDNNNVATCIAKLGFFALYEFYERMDGGNKVGEFPMANIVRNAEDLQHWFPDAMKEACKEENAEKTKDWLKSILLSRNSEYWNNNPADAISEFLALLDEHDAKVLSQNRFRAGQADKIEEFDAPSFEDPSSDRGDGQSSKDPLAARRLSLFESADRLVRIWWELVKRGVCVLVRDKGGCVFLALQGIILAVLLMLAFRDHGSDRFGALDLFAGTVRTNKQAKESMVPIDSGITRSYQSYNWEAVRRDGHSVTNGSETRWKRRQDSSAAKDPWYLDGHARQRGTVLFLVAFAVLWMAVVGGAREISQDYPVIIHEGMLGVGPAAVALSRFAVLWVISCWHAIPLVIAGGWLIEERASLIWYGNAWVSMVCLGGLSTASGMLISAWSRSQRMALVIVPFVTVPQVLFAGVLQAFPLTGPVYNWVAKVLPLRLGWEALLSSGRLWNGGIIQFDWKGVDEKGQDAMATFINSTDVRVLGWRKLYFGDAVWQVDARWITAACTAGMLAMVWWRLRWRIKRGVQG